MDHPNDIFCYSSTFKYHFEDIFSVWVSCINRKNIISVNISSASYFFEYIFSPLKEQFQWRIILHIHVQTQKETQQFSVKRQKYPSNVKAFCNQGLPTYSKYVITPYRFLMKLKCSPVIHSSSDVLFTFGNLHSWLVWQLWRMSL